jgi:hypothetical protein
MVLLRRAGRLLLQQQHQLQQQQVPGLPLLLRSFASNATKEAVERAVVVDTLAQVWCARVASS